MQKATGKTETLSGKRSSKNNNQSKDSCDDDNSKVKEVDGPKGLEPTRYGDWESKGRCHDF